MNIHRVRMHKHTGPCIMPTYKTKKPRKLLCPKKQHTHAHTPLVSVCLQQVTHCRSWEQQQPRGICYTSSRKYHEATIVLWCQLSLSLSLSPSVCVSLLVPGLTLPTPSWTRTRSSHSSLSHSCYIITWRINILLVSPQQKHTGQRDGANGGRSSTI